MKPSIRFEIFKRDGFTCAYCGRRSPDVILEVDHVLATVNGGTDDSENLVTSCWECNRGKAARRLDQTAPVIDVKERAERLDEHERQITEYA
jgi:5-methylcytosine-specific restriction endonuclease McrA